MKQFSPRKQWAFVALIHAFAPLLFTWPLLFHLDSAIWGDRFDAWSTLWLIEHLGQTWGDWNTQTDALLFPLGYDLKGFGHVGLQFIGAPLIALGVSGVLVFNGLLLLAFWATSMACHALGHRLGKSHFAGLVAAGVFVYSPYFYGEMRAGCIELVSCWFLPLQALLLLRLCDRPGPTRALAVAANLGSTALFNWYYTLFTGMFTIAFGIWRFSLGGSNRKRTLGWMTAAVLCAAVSNLPLVGAIRTQAPSRPPISAEQFSAEGWSEAYRLTNSEMGLEALTDEALALHEALQVPINSTSLASLVEAGFGPNPLESTPGALAIALGLFGLIAAGRRAWGWAVIGGAFGLLTLGPFLQIDSTPPIPPWSAQWPLPYLHFYNHIPFFSMAYRPYRLVVVVLLCLAALAAVGIGRIETRRARWLGTVAFLVCASQPIWRAPSGSLASTALPEGYAEVAELPEGGVIELPLLYQPVSTANSRVQYYQALHGKPLLNCNELLLKDDLARFRDYVQDNQFLQALLNIGRTSPPYKFSGADLNSLREDGLRWVIFHTSFIDADTRVEGDSGSANRPKPASIAMLRQTLGKPVIQTSDLEVYEIPGGHLPEKNWHFTGENIVEVPLAHSQLMLPLVVQRQGVELPLNQPDIRVTGFSAWVRGTSTDPIQLVRDSTDEPFSVELKLSLNTWTWLDVIIPGLPADSWSLDAIDHAVELEIDSPTFYTSSGS